VGHLEQIVQWANRAHVSGLGGSISYMKSAGRELMCATADGALLFRLQSVARRGGKLQ